MKTLFALASVMVVFFLAAPNKVEAQNKRPAACTFCGVWEYVANSHGNTDKNYLKISQAGAEKFKLITGYEYPKGNGISWVDGFLIRNADGIYLKMVNGRLVGRFVSANFWATHGTEYTYRITCDLKSNNRLFYSVWSSIRGGETEKAEATKISN